MKSLTVIVNPDYQEGEKPGQFFEIEVKVQDDYTEIDVDFAVLDRLKFTVTSEKAIKG